MKGKLNKKILIILGIILLGLLIIGGTYAYLTFAINITNGNINHSTECFVIDYDIENNIGTTGNTQITGTLFPSINHVGGLSGRVALKVNSACNVTGMGTIYLHVDSGTSNTLVSTVDAHCENSTTLETMNDYTNSTDCLSAQNGTWVSNGTGLKYAVYSNSAGTGTPLGVGYITADKIGSDIELYNNFMINQVLGNYYIFIWMDGYITDNTYTELSFGGYIHASVLQNE